MTIARYLANLGYGTRKETTRLLEHCRVTRASGEPLREGDSFVHGDVRMDGEPLDPPPGSVIMLHKPVNYVCSTRDVAPLVYELLPRRFLHRKPVIAPVGRLDRNTSGLLLLTDDGSLNHRLTSPRRHLVKIYEARLANPLRGDEAAIFEGGTLMLNSETRPLAPAVLKVCDDQRVRLTLTEGRYHQVRRMFAAVGNHVVTLHRVAIGSLLLGDLEPAAWRVLDNQEVGSLLEVSP